MSEGSDNDFFAKQKQANHERGQRATYGTPDINNPTAKTPTEQAADERRQKLIALAKRTGNVAKLAELNNPKK